MKTKNKIPVVVIFAPTASGKTALTRELFSRSGSHFILNAEIISADSQSVYKGMDIGTAKPDKELLKELPHHLIDILTIDKQFNVSDFVSLADKACSEIFEKGKTPVICGGTGFYIRNFLYGVPPTPVCDEELRKEIQQQLKKLGNRALYEKLKEIDSESAEKIHVNDSYRICRALEIYYSGGKTRTSYQVENRFRDEYDFTFIVLEPPRDLLYERIKQRVDLMIEAGLEEEIKSLLNEGYSKDCPGFKAIGYSEWFKYEDKEQIIHAIKHDSCKYAKKQYTYIRDIPGSVVIPYTGVEKDIDSIKAALTKSVLT
ncbi:MAG: tRNA (adenosine(37)-N6)-dimethylallyltransferase MiaA [Treponema sp.]|nr:tRNA (adenosine(37)-N6)-dimethylallyltransferase MiaA [Treponema sp.]